MLFRFVPNDWDCSIADCVHVLCQSVDTDLHYPIGKIVFKISVLPLIGMRSHWTLGIGTRVTALGMCLPVCQRLSDCGLNLGDCLLSLRRVAAMSRTMELVPWAKRDVICKRQVCFFRVQCMWPFHRAGAALFSFLTSHLFVYPNISSYLMA